LYNTILERKIDAKALPVATSVHITMLAQLMDLSAAFGSQLHAVIDARIRERCARLAEESKDLNRLPIATRQQNADPRTDPPVKLLDRIEAAFRSLQSMPKDIGRTNDHELVALASKRVPLLVPNAIRNPDNIALALKLSLCATICYVFYH